MSFVTPLAVAARTGLAAMRANTVRALLSTLGVVIGSAAVVSVLAVSDGVEIYARSRVRAAGFDRVVLRPITDDLIDGQPVARAHVAPLGASDVDSVAPMLGPDEHVVFMRQGFSLATIGATPRQHALTVRGVLLSAPDSLGLDVVAGRALSAAETRAGANVAVVNRTLARTLTGDSSSAHALSDSVPIGARWLHIVGISADDQIPGNARAFGAPLQLVAPLAAVDGMTPGRGAAAVGALMIVSGHAENVRSMRTRVEAWLTQRSPRWRDDYRLEARAESQLVELQRGMLIFRLLMGSITDITLIVGGIGIMNVLLASVAERTREIGIRKAVGARRRDILLQFLAESVAITGAGGVIGTGLGLAGAYGVTAIMRARANAVIFAATTVQTLVISAALALIVGLAFGCYPALRAARLAPIDAIHTE
ncbi:MAG TPA: ABC transporter permease [Gemmatimonadaceae bacterium]|nr:ABC transporter permease [Gemmatimonadaceae bacterium]